MILTRQQIQTAALKLDPADREALAEVLLQSVDEIAAREIDAAWLAEAHRRDVQYQSGKTSAKPVEEVLRRISKKASK